MKNLRKSAIGALVIAASGAAYAEAVAADAHNWGTDQSAFTSAPEYAKSKAVCRRAGEPHPPQCDQPTLAQIKALKGCSAEALYYEPTKPDYAKARLCAFIEADGADDTVFGGSTILMQIYAIGLGVARNLDLATAYACKIEGAPTEVDGRVLHVQAMKTKPGRLDYCEDITSGLAEGYCQGRASDQMKLGRDAKLAALVARMPSAAKPLYASMKTAFDAFVDAHGRGEVDLSGTARAAMEFEEEDRIRNQFLKDLKRLTAGDWLSATNATAAEAELNASYRQALAWAAGKDNDTTIKPEDIRKAQRAWLAYRDAFSRFAAAASPSTKHDAVLTRLTQLRTAGLDQIQG